VRPTSRPDALARPGRPSEPSAVPRRYRVDITRTAARDIATIYAHIEHANPQAAAAWPDTVERNITSLEQWPRRCPIIPEASELEVGYRHLINAPYRTIFRIAGSRVIIIRVIHGAQLLDLDILNR
jgi:plasmid stabilization system protein ParE